MSNGYKSQQVQLTGLSDLLNIINALGQDSAETDKNQLNTANYLNNRVKGASTIEELTNLLPSVDTHNSSVTSSGNDEYVLDYSDKKRVFESLPMAYKQLEDIHNEYAKNPEILAGKLLEGGWEGFTERETMLANLKATIDEGKAYGYKYRGDGTYSQKLLEDALDTRIKANNAAFEALDTYAGEFNLMNPDGTVDEDSQILLDKLKLNIVTGDIGEVQSTINTMTTRSIQGYNAYSNRWKKFSEMIMKHSAGTESNAEALGISDDEDIMSMLDANGFSSKSELPIEWLIDMRRLSLQNAKSFNNQHRVATGILYDENPVWKETEIDRDKIPGLGPDNVLDGMKLTKLDKEILDTSELKQEKKIDVTPAKEKPVQTEVKPAPGSAEYKRQMYKDRKMSEKQDRISEFEKEYPIFNLSIEDMKKNPESIIENLDKAVKSLTPAVTGPIQSLRNKLIREIKFFNKQTEDNQKNPSIQKRLTNRYNKLIKEISAKL